MNDGVRHSTYDIILRATAVADSGSEILCTIRSHRDTETRLLFCNANWVYNADVTDYRNPNLPPRFDVKLVTVLRGVLSVKLPPDMPSAFLRLRSCWNIHLDGASLPSLIENSSPEKGLGRNIDLEWHEGTGLWISRKPFDLPESICVSLEGSSEPIFRMSVRKSNCYVTFPQGTNQRLPDVEVVGKYSARNGWPTIDFWRMEQILREDTAYKMTNEVMREYLEGSGTFEKAVKNVDRW